MKLGGFARRLASPLREFGWAAGALYLADRLLRAVGPHCSLCVYEMVAQPVPEGPLLPLQKTKDVWFKELAPNDPEIAQMPPPAAVKAARFAQGAVSLAVYRKDTFIGYIWFCFGHYQEDEVRCTYRLRDPQQSVFDFDLYVFPPYRLGTAFACVWHAANGYLRARGVRHTFSRISRFNLASRRAHAHLGARCVQQVVFVRLANWQLLLTSKLPWIQVCRAEGAAPTLLLHAAAPTT